ncbi:hypothetical protein BDF22DRAFT_54402 [Syncephalis plumigaleata]|nr:hypothetical protein BDF22DRAFT_54402 [Syncephalis plumigaleata]
MDMHIDENSEFISNFSAPFNQLLLNQKMDTAIQSYGSLAKSYDYSRNDGTATLQDKGHSLVPLPTTVSVYAQQYLMSPSQLALIISHKEETKQATITIKEVDNEEDIASDEKQEEEQELEQENQFTDISISNDTMVDTTTTSLWGDTLVARQESSVRTTVNDMTFEKQVHSDNDSLTELVFANRSTDLTELESKNCDLSSTDDSLLYDATPFGSVELQDDVISTIQSDETFNINLPSSEEVEEQDDDSCDSPVLRSRFSLSIERSNSIQIESILECVNQLELPTVDVDCSETIDRSFFDLADTFMMQLNVRKMQSIGHSLILLIHL